MILLTADVTTTGITTVFEKLGVTAGMLVVMIIAIYFLAKVIIKNFNAASDDYRKCIDKYVERADSKATELKAIYDAHAQEIKALDQAHEERITAITTEYKQTLSAQTDSLTDIVAKQQETITRAVLALDKNNEALDKNSQILGKVLDLLEKR